MIGEFSLGDLGVSVQVSQEIEVDFGFLGQCLSGFLYGALRMLDEIPDIRFANSGNRSLYLGTLPPYSAVAP